MQVDIVSDVVCPWCVIGYSNLMLAVEQSALPGDVAMVWHPYELNPDLPDQGIPMREYLQRKFQLSDAEIDSRLSRLTQIGAAVEFKFDYSRATRIVNTFRAHQLVHWAKSKNSQQQTVLSMKLFEAFFSKGLNVNDLEVLVELAEASGLKAQHTAQFLQRGDFAQAVRASEEYWVKNGVTAVPTFVFDHTYVVTGAQEPEKFQKVLNKLS